MPDLALSIQTASLYASGEASVFTGTGGPFGFSPFTSQFGGVISTRGLGPEPFRDTVYDVAVGDEVIFVVAVQNLTPGQRAYDLGFRATMPPGFVAPADGINLSVTDGAGTELAFTGDLFGAGLRLAGPVAALDQDSGRNIVLATYTAVAGPNLPGPYANAVATASVTHSASSAGGADQGVAATAQTVVVTAAPSPLVVAETSPVAVAKGQSIAFDVSIAIPAGTLQDLRLDTLLPDGSARLKLVSVAIRGVGSGLRLGTPVIEAGGGVSFGTVTSPGGSAGSTAGNSIDVRVVVQADGSVSGGALLQTVLSAGSTVSGGDRWSATVGSNVGVVVPPSPPAISGVTPKQAVTPGMALHPFGGLILSDLDPAGTATLAVTLRDGGLGRMSGGAGGAFDAAGATFSMTGPLAALQEAARRLVFTPSAAGTQQFTVTLVDPAGGVAQDGGTVVGIAGTAADAVQVAAGAALWVPVLRGTVALRGQGALLRADQVSGTPTVLGFGERDSLVLPGDSNALAYSGANGGQLTVGGSTLLLPGFYDAGRFRVRLGAPGSVVVTVLGDPLFDGDLYLARNPDVAAAGMDPYQHYMALGWREGRAASAWFDDRFYLSRNPDVAAAGIQPLLHFEAAGWREGRDPSAGFSTRDYLAANTDVGNAGINPLLHYVTSGRAEGRAAFAVSPLQQDPLVDLAVYYATNPDVRAAGVGANAHYLTMGWREGRNPNAYFDSSYYLTQNPDVRAAGLNPLLHFESNGWAEGRQPSLMFDDAKYLDANPDVRAAGINPLVHFLGGGRDAGRASFLTGGAAAADPLVDGRYLGGQLGATLIPAGLAGAQQAAFSYDHGGWQRGLSPSAWFDTRYYLASNPDVAAARINPLQHFESFGWKENRNPEAGFDTRKYLLAYGDVRGAGMNPLLHYAMFGAAEGRQAFAV